MALYTVKREILRQNEDYSDKEIVRSGIHKKKTIFQHIIILKFDLVLLFCEEA